MARRAKRHLLIKGRRTACGLLSPPFTTSNPAEVTCLACAGTVEMADAEILNNQRH